MIDLGHGIRLDEAELRVKFVRARGPGGQHVNKSSTAVQLMFDVSGSPSLPKSVKRKLMRAAGSYLTNDGVIVLFADRYRSQRRNRQEAVERLVALIREAAAPVKSRIRTKRTTSSVVRRLETKKRRGRTKQERRWRRGDDS